MQRYSKTHKRRLQHLEQPKVADDNKPGIIVMDNFQCKGCLEKFNSRNKLFIHVRNKHENMKDSSGNECIPEFDLTRFTALNDLIVDNTIKIAAEDSSYQVIVKPQGLSTMGETGQKTLMNLDDLLLPGHKNLIYKKAVPCHRLVSNTVFSCSWCLL